MSLKVVKRPGRETLYVRGTIGGHSIYESTGTNNQKQAEAYRAKRETELWQESVYGKRAVITFDRAAAAYLAAAQRSATTITHIERLLAHFKGKKINTIKQQDLDGAYSAILTAGNEAKAATKIRAVLTPLRAILEFSAIRGWCDKPAFERPKVEQVRMQFLRPEEATSLVNEAAPHIRPLLVFLIATGCRMSEALELDWQDVDLDGARAVVWQKQGNERHIDLPKVVLIALRGIPWRDGRVFRPAVKRRDRNGIMRWAVGESYSDTNRTGGGQIKSAWAFANRRAGLPGSERVWTPKNEKWPKRQFVPDMSPHCLRHTFATWHYCAYKDLLKLKEDGGWQTITMVTRYAKKMPDHYREQILQWWGYTDWPEIEYCVPYPGQEVETQGK
ncbi:tyrosine-type recombinase/integrase [Acetobacter orientalis]|uniref:tyrosine-type recombinase/integrase n=1 Tax=Acetobacter orientalis TaxID=146474 RepID=UPI00386BE84D